MGFTAIEDECTLGIEFQNDERRWKDVSKCASHIERVETASQNGSFFLVGKNDVEIKICARREKRLDAHFLDHLKRTRVEGHTGTVFVCEARSASSRGSRRIGEERPCREVKVFGVGDLLGRQLRWHQIEVRAMS